mmetsp:Transcript_17842/g.38933  ORF Transcript_17842/g.38933 Transcript_17842/m.38933 type:complete len:214 (-) Transcript_17842:725-1366(-)
MNDKVNPNIVAVVEKPNEVLVHNKNAAVDAPSSPCAFVLLLVDSTQSSFPSGRSAVIPIDSGDDVGGVDEVCVCSVLVVVVVVVVLVLLGCSSTAGAVVLVSTLSSLSSTIVILSPLTRSLPLLSGNESGSNATSTTAEPAPELSEPGVVLLLAGEELLLLMLLLLLFPASPPPPPPFGKILLLLFEFDTTTDDEIDGRFGGPLFSVGFATGT